MYAGGGRLLKAMVTKEVQEIGPGRWMPITVVMENKLRQDTHTVYHLQQIELD